MRNIHRFLNDDDDKGAEEEIGFSLEQGEFILTKQNRLMEILQLKRKNTFVSQVNGATGISFIAVCYRMVSHGVFYAEPKFTRKYYMSLNAMFHGKVNVLEKWYDDVKKFVRIDMENINIQDGGNDMGNDNDDDNKNCFCRKEDVDDEYIKCSDPDCRIVWFHLKCVKLNSKTVPTGDWFCPRCQGLDHYCICGKNGKSFIALQHCKL